MIMALFGLLQLFSFLLKQKMKRTRIKDSTEISPVVFPMQNSDAHNAFVNSKNNPWGLKAEFFVHENNTCRCEWSNTHTNYQGFANIIHGGILATLADELMANNVLGSLNKFAMSLKAKLEWRRPVKVSEKITAPRGPLPLRKCGLWYRPQGLHPQDFQFEQAKTKRTGKTFT